MHDTGLHAETSLQAAEEQDAVRIVREQVPQGLDVLVNNAGTSAAAGFLPVLEE